MLDRMVGSHHLHSKVAMVLAGNLETDSAIVYPMSTALQSRLVHMELVVDAKEWLDWASDNALDHRITSFIKFKPDMLYTFKPDHTDCTYACPRTWEFSDRLLKVIDSDSPDLLPILSGTVSEGVARELITFCKIFTNLPTIDQIKSGPGTLPIPTEPSIIYALTGSLANHINMDNATELMVFIARLPYEFQFVCMREAVRRNKPILASKAVQQWISNSAMKLF